MEALKKIQAELKAPKGQYNSYGKYNYRSAEDILEAVKPLLSKHNAQLTLSDSIEQVGTRIYVKALATIISDSGESVEVSAYAREPDKGKNGMDESQVTGTASSYARKYALNGLFLIDDTKDADTDEYKAQTSEQNNTQAQKVSQKQMVTIEKLCEQSGTPIGDILNGYKLQRLDDMPAITAGKVIDVLKKRAQSGQA